MFGMCPVCGNELDEDGECWTCGYTKDSFNQSDDSGDY